MVNEKSIKALLKHNVKKQIIKLNLNKNVLNNIDEFIDKLTIDKLKIKGITKIIIDTLIENERLHSQTQASDTQEGGMKRTREDKDDEDDKLYKRDKKDHKKDDKNFICVIFVKKIFTIYSI